MAQEADAAQIGQLIMFARGGRILTAAAALGVFDALADTWSRGATVAKRINADERATVILLDALVALKLAQKRGEDYANTDTGRAYLTSQGKTSIASNLRYQELLAPAWAQLPQIVRSGQPAESLDQLLADRPAFTREYIVGMADISRAPARALAEQLDLTQVRHALDLGGGPAVYAQALIVRAPHLHVTLLDLPSTLALARELLGDSPVRDQITLRSGNYRDDDFGRLAFDLVLMSHITHDEGEAVNQLLIAKAFAALRPGGQLVIHDFILDTERTNPLFGALFSVHMLTYTREGRSYSADEYRCWFMESGFREPQQIEICAGRPNATRAMVAIKP